MATWSLWVASSAHFPVHAGKQVTLIDPVQARFDNIDAGDITWRFMGSYKWGY